MGKKEQPVAASDGQSRYALFYWLFEPLRGGLNDDSDRVPTFSVPVVFEEITYEFAFFVDAQGSPELARLTIPGLREDRLPDGIDPVLNLVKEHLLSILRLGYREDIRIFPINMWAFFRDGSPHKTDVRVEFNPPSTLDAEGVRDVFVQSFPYRHELRLLVDGNDRRLPVQYRYLSLYKMLEHEFKSKGQWQTRKLDDFLNKYADRFPKSGQFATPARRLHALRDKCAHIKTGRFKEVLGVTSLNHRETKLVAEVMPALLDVCKDLLNEKAASAFQLGDIRPWYERVDMAQRHVRSPKA